MRLLAALLTTSLFVNAATPVAKTSFAQLLDDPFGPAQGIASPDGRYALWADYPKSQLWLEDRSTRRNRLIGPYTVQTISLAWSPDSRHFVVNDRETTTESDAYLYDADTLQRTRLRDTMTTSFPEATRYLVSDKPGPERGMVSHGRGVMHSYVDVRRWIDDSHVELQLHGNFSGRFRNDNPDGHLYSGGCFDLRFRMGLDGSTQRLSKQTKEPLSEDPACGWGPN